MVEEIVEALRHADPLFCKLQNHKPDGSVYQLCLCLTPVFNVDGEGPAVNRHAERQHAIAAMCSRNMIHM